MLATLQKHGIDPIGGDHSPRVFSEHRVVEAPGSSKVTAPEVPVEHDQPVLVVDNTGSLAGAAAQAKPAAASDRVVVEAGDTVIVRYADDNRVRLFRLSADHDDPERGVVHVGRPIGAALIGNGVEEEVELSVGGQTRTVIIEKVTKAA